MLPLCTIAKFRNETLRILILIWRRKASFVEMKVNKETNMD